jgi:putative CocE/NonD family hydrolase
MTMRSYSRFWKITLLAFGMLAIPAVAPAQEKEDSAAYIREHYTKQEYRVPMRDGVRLFTAVYTPKDASQAYPILMQRTPYSVAPYGKEDYRSELGPSHFFAREGYIFAYQDVRGCFMSEGKFDNMRPHLDKKTSKRDIDESSDTFDTIEWLLAKVPNHNGRVGQWGISYPGFYSSAGMIDAHPALKAVSPQAPIADWFFDDFHHHGAFFLPHAFGFFSVFGPVRPEPTTRWAKRFEYGTPDGYQFYLNLGPLKNANERYFKDRIPFWNRMVDHPNYDAFWQARNLLPHLKKVAPAVMTVGGWFDAEDLYGALKTYRAIEKQNPDSFNVLVMGPWLHGGWSRGDGDKLGNIHFGAKTARFYQQHMELPFFEYFLKDKGEHGLPEAYVFETGANRWQRFDTWPPKLETRKLYFHQGGRLKFDTPAEEGEAYDSYVSDPNHPVPFTEAIATGMTVEYMTDDQRFASRRPDTLAYQTEVLDRDITLAGPLRADLRVSTSGTDSDWVVKLIDVFPNEAQDPPDLPSGRHLGGYEMMVRSEVIRGRFRNSYERPEPFVPNEPTKVSLELQDVLHTFAKGHRIMVQIQSTWFPLVDRNPQKYVDNIFLADPKDFIKTTQRIYRSKQQPTCVEIGVLPASPQ